MAPCENDLDLALLGAACHFMYLRKFYVVNTDFTSFVHI